MPQDLNLVEKIKKFFSISVSEKDEILKILMDDYSKEITLAKNLEEHAKMIPYEHLKEKVKKIASEERKHAEMLKEKITELGGEVKPVTKPYEFKTQSIHSSAGFRKLIADLEFEGEIYEDYIAQINKLENEDVKKLLENILTDEHAHKDELTDVVMRLC